MIHVYNDFYSSDPMRLQGIALCLKCPSYIDIVVLDKNDWANTAIIGDTHIETVMLHFLASKC